MEVACWRTRHFEAERLKDSTIVLRLLPPAFGFPVVIVALATA
jgi:hypothetical protein